MAFFNSAVNVLQTLVVAIGAGLGIWGIVNLLEGYGNDNPGAKSQGIKQLMAGAGVALIGTTLIPLLTNILYLREVSISTYQFIYSSYIFNLNIAHTYAPYYMSFSVSCVPMLIHEKRHYPFG